MPSEHLVDTNWLAARLGEPNLRIVDIRGHLLWEQRGDGVLWKPAREEYEQAHISGSLFLDFLTTLQLIWREGPTMFRSRNPFPVGGVVEDPATGAAAAALGGYLRDASLVAVPDTILIKQGDDIGRPSRLIVEIPASGGIVVRGTAVSIDSEQGGACSADQTD